MTSRVCVGSTDTDNREVQLCNAVCMSLTDGSCEFFQWTIVSLSAVGNLLWTHCRALAQETASPSCCDIACLSSAWLIPILGIGGWFVWDEYPMQSAPDFPNRNALCADERMTRYR